MNKLALRWLAPAGLALAGAALLLPNVLPAACLNAALLAETRGMRQRLSAYDALLPSSPIEACAQNTAAQDHTWTFLPARVAAHSSGWPAGLPDYVTAQPQDYFAVKALADEYLDAGDLTQSLELFRSIADANTLYLLGMWARAEGDPVRAERYSQLAVTLAPDWSLAWFQLAEIQFHTADPESMASYQMVLASDPAPELAAYAHMRIGSLLANRGQWAEARAEFETALALDPGSFSAMEQMGRLALAQGNLAEACEWARQSQALAPDNVWVVDLLADLNELSACKR